MTARRFWYLMVTFSLICFYGVSYHGLLAKRTQLRKDSDFRTAQRGIWSLPPVVLQIVSGEFKGLISDYLTMEVGAQLGTEIRRIGSGRYERVKKTIDWPSIIQIFNASQVLDPAFAQTFIIAQGWLSWEAKRPKEAMDILQIAAKARTWDWLPTQLMGFNTYYFLNDPGAAGEIYLRAAKIVNAPEDYLMIVGSRLIQKGGQTETGIIIMRKMVGEMDKKDPGYYNIQKRIQALEGTLVLERAVSEYKNKMNILPASVSTLVAEGFLSKIPANPYELSYCIDHSGKVYFDNPQCRVVSE